TISFRADRVRLVALIKRKSTLSKEEFSRLVLVWKTWRSIFVLDIVKTNLVKYEQVRPLGAPLSSQFKNMGAPMTDWDGMAIFRRELCQDLRGLVFQSEEYAKVVIPDEEQFLGRKGSQLFPLDLITVIDKQTCFIANLYMYVQCIIFYPYIDSRV
ncbi:hypothetical protein B0H10DRAFT_1814201, partial [Mycena sp. CBHHK59/15]